MKKILLTVAMLLSAAGMQAAAAPEFAVKLQTKAGERLGLYSSVSGMYWKNNTTSNPDQIWGIGGIITTKNKALEAELQKCKIQKQQNNFIDSDTKKYFPADAPIQAYSFQCLANFAKKHPGELGYTQLYGEHKGESLPFTEDVFKITTWPKF